MDLIFFEAYMQDKIWGGSKLRDKYGLEIPTETTGEAWMISGHPNGMSKVKSPEKYKDISLNTLYKENGDLFGPNRKDSFPLLIKIIDAKEDLSIQVHPGDDYALKHENELGKTECWYILDCEDNSEIIYGHNAKNKDEFIKYIEDNKWKQLLKNKKIKKGDFINVDNGTIHAIKGGIMLLEIQQSSDVTYRLYDYDRPGSDGKLRDLHIKESIDVAKIPHKEENFEIIKKEISSSSFIEKYLKNKYFSVYKMTIDGKEKIDLKDDYYLCVVIDGNGKIFFDNKEYKINTPDSFLIPYGKKNIEIEGNTEIIFVKEEN